VRLTKSGSGVRLRLNLAESHVLEQVFIELQETLAPDALDPSDPVRQRLYPAAYPDPDAAQEYRELTEEGLREDRTARVDECLAEVVSGRTLRRTEVVLDAEGAERWMRVLNDLRLAFGTRLNISEDDEYELDEDDPQVHVRARYLWLTALQDALVMTVMG
jgi:uncharacterized protein DUF2017